MRSRRRATSLLAGVLLAGPVAMLAACGDAGSSDAGSTSSSDPDAAGGLTIAPSRTDAASAAAAALVDPCTLVDAAGIRSITGLPLKPSSSTLADLGLSTRTCDYSRPPTAAALHDPFVDLAVTGGSVPLASVVGLATAGGDSTQSVAPAPAVPGADETAEIDDADPEAPSVIVFATHGDAVLSATVGGDSVAQSRRLAIAVVSAAVAH